MITSFSLQADASESLCLSESGKEGSAEQEAVQSHFITNVEPH